MRVVVADDVMLTREGIARLLTEAGIEVAAQAGDAAALLHAVRTTQPDAAIIDIRMPPTHTDEDRRHAHAGSPTEGREGSPSVAALAIHVNSLRREIEDLATKIGGLVAKQREHTAVLHDLTHLRQQVEQILATLTEDDDAPSTWFWLTMSDQERGEKFAELHDWVEQCSAFSIPTTSPTTSIPAGRTTPRPSGNWPGCTTSGPAPTWLTNACRKPRLTGTTAGHPV